MPNEIAEVRKLCRSGVGSGSVTSGVNFDPFEASFSNYYLLQTGRTGGMATWDFFSQYQETLGRIFGSELDFTWNTNTKKLTIIRKISNPEDILIVCWNTRPEDMILRDPYSGPWVRDYSLARCKVMLGEARSKFTSGFAGPGGKINEQNQN